MEEKQKVGKRRLAILERTGLLGMLPMLHIHYSKMDKGDMRSVLTKRYDPDDTSAATEICRRRQESVRKNVVAQNYMWGTAWGMTGLAWWSLRRYNYQSRLVVLPFLFYGGTFVGRAVGDIVTRRNGEFARDRFLGQLPAKVYFTGSD
eukprot:SRR837773.1656.p2 GENE.SRR837773.1656~~SRR837773.1656.p2  ORF type:complete len:164 (-),score=56.68 SRR837773.1656:93-536(-)